jgi:beta-mannan synthase
VPGDLPQRHPDSNPSPSPSPKPNLFCRYQEICLNAHIKCEQYARFSTGNFFNFNGTGGVWRKACIDDAGGWNARTLVEDMVRPTAPYCALRPLARTLHTLALPYAHFTHPYTPLTHPLHTPYVPLQDLSLRAFLKGWQFVWCYDMECPNEIPSDYKAYRKQQRRWSCGPMQLWAAARQSVRRSTLQPCCNHAATIDPEAATPCIQAATPPHPMAPGG